jgi:putative ABC transport system ATP-binding protein
MTKTPFSSHEAVILACYTHRKTRRSAHSTLRKACNNMTTRTHSEARQTEDTTAPAALSALDVYKSLPLGRERIDILKGINLRIERGELVAIIGPSGSGKSTLLGIIAGLDSPTTGRVLIDGVDTTQMGEGKLAAVRNAKIGMVFQAFNLIPTLTAQENVELPLYVGRHVGRPGERAKQLLSLVGLGHRLRNRPNQLSGGEQQRVAVARALVTSPAIVIMDEPTGNLDHANSENILRLIRDLREATGTTFIIATHDASVAATADRLVTIVDGQVMPVQS